MFKRELGDLYRADLADKIAQSHRLVEQWFGALAKDRPAIVRQIDALGLEPAVVGRITRIRSDWPALEGGVYYINERVGPHDVMYFVGIPKDYDRTKPWPLLIKLPTAHAFVTDPAPDAEQVAAIYTGWIKDELAAHPDAIVLMPRLNLTELWGPSMPGMNTVIQPLRHVMDQANVDPARIYLHGHGMSAHAVWNLGFHYTTYFAALSPLAGGARAEFQRVRMMNLLNVPIVAWHDQQDKVVPVDESRQLVWNLKRFGCTVDYEETKDVGHAPTAEIAERVYSKMRQHKRELYPKRLSIRSTRPETMFNRSDWLQMWQPIVGGREQRMRFTRGSGFLRVYEFTFTVFAERKPDNRFEIRTENVDSIRLLFNEQMVDFSKPVTVLVNGKERFKGMLKQDLGEMLGDQLFLGRGFRYFTAVLDIDIFARSVPATGPTTSATSRPRGTIEVIRPGSDKPQVIEVP